MDDVFLDVYIKLFSKKIVHIKSDKMFRLIGKISKDEKKLLVLKADSESKNVSESNFKGMIGFIENLYKKSNVSEYITMKKLIKKYFASVYKVIRKMLKKIKIKNFDISFIVGLGDAADTAIASGSVYMLLSFVLVFLENYFTVENVRQNVVPRFSENHLEGDINCIIEIRIVNIIYGSICILAYSVTAAIRIVIERLKHITERKEMKGSVQYG